MHAKTRGAFAVTTVSNFIVYQVYGRLGAFKGRKRWSDDKLLSRVLSAKTYRWDNLNVLELKSRPSAGLYERCIELTKSKLPAERVVGVGIVSSFFREGKKCRTKYPYRKEALKLIINRLNHRLWRCDRKRFDRTRVELHVGSRLNPPSHRVVQGGESLCENGKSRPTSLGTAFTISSSSPNTGRKRYLEGFGKR